MAKTETTYVGSLWIAETPEESAALQLISYLATLHGWTVGGYESEERTPTVIDNALDLGR